MAAMAPERSRTLHNFSLPPRLNWGAQRLLRCAKTNHTSTTSDDQFDDRHHDGSSSSASRIRRRDTAERKRRSPHDRPPKNNHHHPSSPSTTTASGRGFRDEDGIEVVREKLMIDLQTEVDKMRIAILGQGGGDVNHNLQRRHSPPTENGNTTSVIKDPKPWNLRTRRSVFKEPTPNYANNTSHMKPAEDGRYRSPTPAPVGIDTDSVAVDGSYAAAVEKRERAKFSVNLSRQEIEEDFMELTGRRPARKPRKRPKYVQKQLDALFPGLWLSEITAEMYKVNEIPEPGKGQ